MSAYVDDLLFFQVDTEVTGVFKPMQGQVLLRPTGELLIGQTISFRGRQLTNKGEYIEITLGDKYMNTLRARHAQPQTREHARDGST